MAKIFSLRSMNAKLMPFIDAIEPLWPNCDAISLYFRLEHRRQTEMLATDMDGHFISASEFFSRILFDDKIKLNCVET